MARPPGAAKATSDPARVLIAGGGVAALEALLALRELAGTRVAIELLSPVPEFTYRPLAVAEPFGIGRTRRYKLDSIVRDQGARLHPDRLAEVRADERQVVTDAGERLGYDMLVVALGAVAKARLPGGITVEGEHYRQRFGDLLARVSDGRIGRLAFVAPPGVSWTLPLYELALLTRRHAADAGRGGIELALVTPEAEPLGLFGAAASQATTALLAERRIEFVSGRAVDVDSAGVHFAAAGPPTLPAETVVSLPTLGGPCVRGLPHDGDGFIRTDLHGRVQGVEGVYAAGDVTTFPIKQGGLATQQADAAAESIAAEVGAKVDPRPFRPVLRGMLLTGTAPQYMRAGLTGDDESSETASSALWWPPSKIAGRYLSPYLGVRHAEFEAGPGSIPIEVELEAGPAAGVRRRAVVSPGIGLLPTKGERE